MFHFSDENLLISCEKCRAFMCVAFKFFVLKEWFSCISFEIRIPFWFLNCPLHRTYSFKILRCIQIWLFEDDLRPIRPGWHGISYRRNGICITANSSNLLVHLFFFTLGLTNACHQASRKKTKPWFKEVFLLLSQTVILLKSSFLLPSFSSLFIFPTSRWTSIKFTCGMQLKNLQVKIHLLKLVDIQLGCF